jgi:leucyl-tRNA synthetase
MYARFFTKALADSGVLPATMREPFMKLFTQGMIRLGGDKMSKSKGNLVAPEEILDTDGADALRLAHLFVGPPQDDVDWEGVGLDGCSRFLQRLWRLATGRVGPESLQRDPSADDDQIERSVHRLIARVSDDYERWSYNTAVAACMEMTNELYRYVQAASPPRRETIDFGVDTLLLLLAPMAPHLTAELWEQRRGGHIHEEQWPTPDPSKLAVETVTMVVQVNGKVRDRIEVSAGIGEDEARALALSSPKVMAAADGREPRSVVCRPPRLVNVVL